MVANKSSVPGDSLDEDFLKFEATVEIVIPVIFGLITLLGLLGNSLVIYVVITNKKMQTTSDLLILNLAVADILFLLVCVPFTAIIYTLPRWIFGSLWCKIVQYFIYVSACVSIYTLVCMSIARYIAVVHPLSAKSFMTKRNTMLIILLIWVIILLGFSPNLIQFGVFRYTYNGEERVACTNIQTLNSETLRKLFYGSFFLLGYCLPLVLMIILYTILLVVLLCGSNESRIRTLERSRNNTRTTIVVVVVVITFMICWLPNHVIFMIQTFGDFGHNASGIAAQMAANCLAYSNSCINPILYTFLSTRFRQSFKRAMCCARNKQETSESAACTQQVYLRGSQNEDKSMEATV